MKEKNESGGGGGYVRADQIDLKSLDEQLQRHLSRAWTMEKNKNRNDNEDHRPIIIKSTTSTRRVTRQDWEIDPSKLIIEGARFFFWHCSPWHL
ncbi:hypothetical protein Ddye_012882 [Dipteronia dyeriana]|uniref:Uncharacterized protein n=1 Tax=Dipteronia dyeriana TaxID=168575 RepID=A0AAD9X544_9ROSI|nr:hypothetical protein Ddye_012882 [Dipteronia dyeriana]